MNERIAIATAAAVIMAAATAGPAAAQTAFTDWDANGNNGIGPIEWNNGWSSFGAFPSMDMDNDGALSADELASAAGIDQTGTVEGASDNPFTQRFGQNAFSQWDVNGDGMLTQREFYTGTFQAYDENDDGVLGTGEFSAFADDFGEGGFWSIRS